VVFPPRSREALLRGAETLVAAIKPTLGPLPRFVAVAPTPGSSRSVELLDDGGLVARRVVSLPDRDEDAGAMLVRHVAWRVRERCGDGSATAAVLFGAVFAGTVRAIAAGADPWRLRHGLELGRRIVVDELARLTRREVCPDALVELAASLSGDAELAPVLGEVFGVIGVDGDLEFRPSLGRDIRWESIEGAYWEAGFFARAVAPSRSAERTILRDAAIAITDLEIDDQADLAALLDRSRVTGARSLVIVARRLSDRALGLLAANAAHADGDGQTSSASSRGDRDLTAIAVRAPGTSPEEQYAALEELALLCGGTPILSAAGQTLASLSPPCFGRAQRAWATATHFGVSGGRGDPTAARKRIESLRRATEAANTTDERERLQRRIGKLTARSAVVAVGGPSEREGKARRERARQTTLVLREALRSGLLPGGGTALLACRQPLAAARDSADDWETRAALQILISAVEAPFRTIAANAGHDPDRWLHAVSIAPAGHGFDAIRGAVVDLVPAGIADAATVQRVAVETALSAAGQACTIGVLVHPRRREPSVTP
jgi:chaperonin GroEL